MKILIVIDMQKGFMTNKNYENLNFKVENLITSSNYDKVIYTKFINKKNSLYETKIKWTGLQDKESQEFSINVPENATIFTKYGYGLTSRQLNQIKRLGVDSVDICGLQTTCCVYAISLQLFDIGIYPNILINYVEGKTRLRDFFERYAFSYLW